MSAHCCSTPTATTPPADPVYRRVLWIALVLNAAMFAVELGASWTVLHQARSELAQAHAH